MPYGIEQIRRKTPAAHGQVQCHIGDCATLVAKPTRQSASSCNTHGIFIHTNTYRHTDWRDNIIWDKDRIDWYGEHKRENRMANENSEDALTWNVFRAFERSQSVDPLVTFLTGRQSTQARMYLWSLEHKKGMWEPFQRISHSIFDETVGKGTETDVILHAPGSALVFIEAKFGSANEADKPLRDRYTKLSWSNEALNGPCSGHYQLARNWLLGTYLASKDELDVPFWLISLVREEDDHEKDVEASFHGKFCKAREGWHFRRVTWEDVATSAVPKLPTPEREQLTTYLKGKTLSLKRAFKL